VAGAAWLRASPLIQLRLPRQCRAAQRRADPARLAATAPGDGILMIPVSGFDVVRRRGRPLLRRAHSGRDHVMAPRRRAAGSAQPPADQPLARPVAHHAVSTVWIAPPDPGAFIVEPRRLLTIKARAEQATRPGLAHPPLSRKALIPGHHAVNPALLPPAATPISGRAATPISGRSVRASPPSDRSPLEQIFGVRCGATTARFIRSSHSVTAAHPGSWRGRYLHVRNPLPAIHGFLTATARAGGLILATCDLAGLARSDLRVLSLLDLPGRGR
jgi:hypothetical protein